MQKWYTGVEVRTAAIQTAEYVTCECGAYVIAEEGILQVRRFNRRSVDEDILDDVWGDLGLRWHMTRFKPGYMAS